MKKFLFILFFTTIFVSNSDSFPFKVERLAVNLNGIAFNESCLLVYGGGSIILRSEDKGASWEQILVDTSDYEIKKIIWTGNEFLGVLKAGRVIQSDLEGKNWTIRKLPGINNINDLIIKNGKIIILSDSSIYFYDYSFELENTLSVETKTKASEFVSTSRYLFVAADSGKLIRYDFENNYSTDIIDFHKFFVGTSYSNPSKLKIYDDKLYAYIGKILYMSQDNGFNWVQLDKFSNSYSVRNGDCYFLLSDYDYNKKLSKPYYFRNNDSNRVKINREPELRFINLNHYNQMEFVSDNILIAVGNDKFIMMSYNGGIDWEYKSNIALNTFNSFWFDEKKGYAINDDGRIFKTNDGGVTFLPQLFNPAGYSGIIGFISSYFDSTGFGILNFKNDYGGPNVLLTKNGGENFSHYTVQDLNELCDESSGFIKSNNTYNYIQSDKFGSNYLTRIFVFDENLKRVNFRRLDSLEIVKFRKLNDEGLYESIGWENKAYRSQYTFDCISYYLMRSTDYGFTWEKEFNFKLPHYYKNSCFIDNKYIITTVYYDSLLIAHTFLNIFDVESKKIIDSIYIGEASYGSIINMKNILYIPWYNKIIHNNNFLEQNNNWTSDFSDYYRFKKCYWNNDSIAYLFTIDSTYKYYFLSKLTLNEKMLDVDYQVEELYLFTEKPFPLPAKSKVSSLIYWDSSSDIGTDEILVFDVEGNKAQGKENITIDRVNSYSAYLRWDCSGVPNGIYLIKIKHGTTTKSIKVIVER